MNQKYPQNLKEAIILGLVNSFIMVLGMMSFNLYLNDSLTVNNLIYGIGPVFVVAFLLSFLVVSKVVGFIVNKYKIYKFMPFLMVFFMAGIMSFLAPFIEIGSVMSLGQYLIVFPRNYVVALLLQVLISMPFALFVLSKYRVIFLSK